MIGGASTGAARGGSRAPRRNAGGGRGVRTLPRSDEASYVTGAVLTVDGGLAA